MEDKKPDAIDTSNLKEPCDCILCGEFVELQSMYQCEECERLTCKECGGYERMGMTICDECREHNHD